MNPPEPTFDPLNNSANLQSIIDRMAKAGWLEGPQASTPEWFKLSFSSEGQRRINNLCDSLVDAMPDYFKARDISKLNKDQIQPSPLKMMAFHGLFEPFINALRPPPFSPGEIDTLRALLYYTAYKKGHNQLPPDRDAESGEPCPRF